jgi:peptide deformylase
VNILRFPNPHLREISEPVKVFNSSLRESKDMLVEFIYLNKGCVGIAAPQTGWMQRLIAVDVTGHKKADVQSGLLVMVNPYIVMSSGSSVNREGCLSVPDFTGNIERADKIRVIYYDVEGDTKEIETTGFEAVVIQHEMDHLDGVLFIDRIRNSKRDMFKRKNY